MNLFQSLIVAAVLSAPPLPGNIANAAGDCSAAAAEVVRQTNGQLLSAVYETLNGQPVCTITVLASGGGNERPKKVTVSVPQ